MQQSMAEILQDDPSARNQYSETQTCSSVVTQTFPEIGSSSYHPTRLPESEDLVSAFQGLNLSNGASQIDSRRTFLHGLRNAQGQASRSLNPSHSSNSNFPSFSSSYFPSPSMISNSNLSSGYPSSYLPPHFKDSAFSTSSSDRDVEDPLYVKYMKAVECIKSGLGSPRLNEHAYVDSLRARQFDERLLGHNDYMNTASALNPGRLTRQNLHFNPGTINTYGGDVVGFRVRSVDENLVKVFPLALLEGFRNNKNVHIELPDIIGFVREFSTDQFGSRFIQQKLENAPMEEKNMIFKEILENALLLITDVFGNYVIQKFFEYGSRQHIRELADKLYTHVLDLSLHTYGCRVMQKAVEIIDYDQQIKLVAELNGHVLTCVIDQNGNHVIQKCIEFVPEDAIRFIINSFYGNIATLSTHAYGCRVVQRVLEHCSDSKTLKTIMDEVLTCVCKLALDPFGNYVVQHILEHGKPSERSVIIKKLAGQIVKMSQQKFASNVVEKCLTFSTPADRQLLIAEMLGNTDENAPLQAMMIDQFGNYVVQKILETCDDKQRELILSRIKVHLNALKKFTYGKHIVARVEKLVLDGERSNGQLAMKMA